MPLLVFACSTFASTCLHISAWSRPIVSAHVFVSGCACEFERGRISVSSFAPMRRRMSANFAVRVNSDAFVRVVAFVRYAPSLHFCLL